MKHQGNLVKEWIGRNHNSINSLATKTAHDVPDKDYIKTQASAVNLLHNISRQEFLKPSWHRKWSVKIAPFIGVSLDEVLKHMGESKDRAEGEVITAGQKEYLKLLGKYEQIKEDFNSLLDKVGDSLQPTEV